MYTIKNFLPLILIFSSIIAFTYFRQYRLHGFHLQSAMYDFMGAFFLIFSLFKIYNLAGFVHAYSMYDLVAKQCDLYAYAYPFIELALGIMYLGRYHLVAAHWITLVLMIIGSIGVSLELAQGKTIICACLGAVFEIPMTYVTLLEDVIMGVMALIMLIQYYF